MSGSSPERSAGTSPGAGSTDPPREAVWDRLDRVDDPELDTSIVELDYVDRVHVDDGAVDVAFTLPTAWCSPAFAWMMATDARDEIESLPGTESVTVELRDHMHGEEITRGVNARDSFGSVFPDADGGVDAVRATLDDKARFARQHDAVAACRAAGLSPEQIVGLTRGDVDLTEAGAVVGLDGVNVVVERAPVAEYLEKARASGHVTDADDRLFRTQDGDPIPVEQFEMMQKRTRLASVNVGGQGAVCDALNESRREKLDRD